MMSSRKSSPYWNHFKKIKSTSAVCLYCDKVIATSGNTSNLKGHYVSIHVTNDKSKKRIHSQSSFDLYSKKSKQNPTDESLNSGSSFTPEFTSTLDPTPGCSSNPDFASTLDQNPGCSSTPDVIPTLKPTSSKNLTSVKDSTSETSARINNPNVSSSLSTRDSQSKESIDDVFKNIKSFQEGGLKHNNLTDKILFMICKDNQHVATVEREGFQELIKHVAPHYKLPCRKTFKQKYTKISSNYKEILKTVKDITLTMDFWTDTLNTRSFLGITAHYIVGSEIVSVAIGVYEFAVCHTSANIAEKLEVCTEWRIDLENITAIVTDIAANIVKAVEDFVGKRKHLGCYAHKINLVATNSIKAVEGLPGLIQKVKSIVTWFKKSNKASDELRAASDLKLKQDVETRWNSTFYMLKRFILLCNIVHGIIFKHASAPPMVSPQEIDQLKDVAEVLKPLEEITREWSAEKYVTLSKVIPMINGLTEQLQTLEPSTLMGKKRKICMLSEINKRFGQVEKVPMFAIATLLDPRFKKIDFKSSIDCSQAVNFVKNTLLQQPQPFRESYEVQEPTEIVLGEQSESTLWKRHQLLVQMDQQKRKRMQSYEEKVDELSLFLRTPTTDLKEDPIKWWTEMIPVYPELAKVALKYLSIMATSVPSERLFSKAGESMKARRNRLLGRNLHKQLFLSSLAKTLWRRINGVCTSEVYKDCKLDNCLLQSSEISSTVLRYDERLNRS